MFRWCWASTINGESLAPSTGARRGAGLLGQANQQGARPQISPAGAGGVGERGQGQLGEQLLVKAGEQGGRADTAGETSCSSPKEASKAVTAPGSIWPRPARPSSTSHCRALESRPRASAGASTWVVAGVGLRRAPQQRVELGAPRRRREAPCRASRAAARPIIAASWAGPEHAALTESVTKRAQRAAVEGAGEGAQGVALGVREATRAAEQDLIEGGRARRWLQRSPAAPTAEGVGSIRSPVSR
jgi:hypothetical protein